MKLTAAILVALSALASSAATSPCTRRRSAHA